jgi:hypothetical protein
LIHGYGWGAIHSTRMKKFASLIMSLALASSAFAGPVSYSGKGGKFVQPTEPPPVGCDAFGPGFALGVFGGGYLPENDSFEDDALGGGVVAE